MIQVHIVGGGPAGLYCAYQLLKAKPKGMRVTVYEENEQVGLPVQCTGLLSGSIEGLPLPHQVIAMQVSKAAIVSPEGRHLLIRFKHPNTVVYRHLFDQHIASLAKAAGAAVRYGCKLIGVTKEGLQLKRPRTEHRTTVKLDPDTTTIVIGADGPNSTLAKSLGIYGERELLWAIQATIRVKHDSTIRFWPHIGEYAWLVPESRDRARIGVAAGAGEVRTIYDGFVKSFRGEQVSMLAGPIPKYAPGMRTQLTKGNTHYYLLGDAACQIKNTSGGGIIPGTRCADALAETILSGNYQGYEQAWRRKVGRELYAHYLLNKAFNRFSEKDWNLLVSYFQKPGLRKVLAEVERDNAARMLPRLLWHEPRLLRFGLKAF